jgi:hypothetical protein
MEITKSNNLPPQPPPTSHVANLTVDDFICTNDDTGNVTHLTNQQTNIENLLHALKRIWGTSLSICKALQQSARLCPWRAGVLQVGRALLIGEGGINVFTPLPPPTF